MSRCATLLLVFLCACALGVFGGETDREEERTDALSPWQAMLGKIKDFVPPDIMKNLLSGLAVLCTSVGAAALTPLKKRMQESWQKYRDRQRDIENRKHNATMKWHELFPGANSVQFDDFLTKAATIREIQYLTQDGFELNWLARNMDRDGDRILTIHEYVKWFTTDLAKLRPDMYNDSVLHTVFVGPAGHGKSTLINSIIGEAKVAAGLPPTNGFGVTQEEFHPEVVSRSATPRSKYPNLPGFQADKHQQVHLNSIETALKGNYAKLFFVLTLEAGRVDDRHKNLISMTLARVPTVMHYGIIVNKCSPGEMQRSTEAAYVRGLLDALTSVTRGLPPPRPSPKIFFLERFADIDGQNKALMKISQEFRHFLFETHSNDLVRNTDLTFDKSLQWKNIQEIQYERDPPQIWQPRYWLKRPPPPTEPGTEPKAKHIKN